jgi:hypothetical protein
MCIVVELDPKTKRSVPTRVFAEMIHRFVSEQVQQEAKVESLIDDFVS